MLRWRGIHQLCPGARKRPFQPLAFAVFVIFGASCICGARAATTAAPSQSLVDRTFEGDIIHGVPHLYNSDGTLKNGLQPLRLLTQRPESGGVGDAMGKLVPVFELVLQAINNESNVLPGYVVELHLTDSKCKPETGVQSTIKLLNKYPKGFFKAVFGPLCSDPTGAVNDVIQAYNLFQVASISRSPKLSDGLRYPYLCRLSPALSFVAQGIQKTVELFGWTRIALLRDTRALSDATIVSMNSFLNEAKGKYDAGLVGGYPFDTGYSALNSFIIDSTTNEVAVVAAIKDAKVRVLVGALYEDAGLRFLCELYKQGYYGKKLQFILATGWWADSWIDEQLGEQAGTTLAQSGGGCSREQVYLAAKDMMSVAQATWFQSPGRKHDVTKVDLFALRQGYYTMCRQGEGCHNDFAAADYDGLSTMINTFDVWLKNGGNLSSVDYENSLPADELYNIALRTDFLGVTGLVRFYNSSDFACERQGSFTVKQYSNLPSVAGEDGWINRASFTNANGFGELQTWLPYHWQDGTQTYLGSGTGWVPVKPGVVATFGNDATGLDNVISDFKYCPPGTTVDDAGGSCVDCAIGKYGQEGVCKDCPRGTHAARAGMPLCPNCPSGTFQNATGAGNCTMCLAGTVSDAESPWQCKPCPPGKLSSIDGLDTCEVCDAGTFQDTKGTSSCIPCSVALGDVALWTTGTGSTTRDECVCNKGYFRRLAIHDGTSGNKCKECPGGMECPDAGGSEEALSLVASAKPATSSGGFRALLLKRYPLVQEGYMTIPSNPLQVYRCADKAHCPGGSPGTCGAFRDNTKVACARCIEGAYETGEGICEKCDGQGAGLLLVFVLIAGVACLVVMTVVVNRSTLHQHSSIMAIIIIMTMMFSGVQTLGVFHNLNVVFFEPLSTVLSAMMLFSFQLEVLKLGCIFPFNPVQQYLLRQLVPPGCAAVIFVISLVKPYIKKSTMGFRAEYVNTVGTIYVVFFLSIVVSAMVPLICYAHPGESGSSVLASPSILCFNDSRHQWMVAIGLLSFIMVVIPFMALAGWSTWMYPRWTASIGPAASARLWMFRWLFFRFKPPVYFYGLIFLTRNLLICLVPVLPGARDDQAFQVILMCALLMGFALVMAFLQPWRAKVTNVADGVLTSLLVLILLCGVLTTDFTANESSIQILGITIFSIWVGSGVASFAYFAYRWSRKHYKKYHFFICHHKVGAGAFSRLLKYNLARSQGIRGQVFIDSDDLTDLDHLFDTVGNDTDSLAIVCTREILTRPWCVGEIVTAKARGVQAVRIILSDFEEPTDEWIDDCQNHIHDVGQLGEVGISLPVVQETLHWFRQLPTLIMPETLSAGTIQHLANRLVTCDYGEVQPAKDLNVTSQSVIIVDHTNHEAASTGELLSNMLVTQFVEEPDKIPYVLPQGQSVPRTVQDVLIVCTPGAFQQRAFMKALVQSAELRSRFVPILADEKFRFPSGEGIEEQRPMAASISDDPDAILRLITELFQAIAISFYANQSSEDILQAMIHAVCRRMGSNVAAKRFTQTPCGSPSDQHLRDEGDDDNLSGDNQGQEAETWATSPINMPRPHQPSKWQLSLAKENDTI